MLANNSERLNIWLLLEDKYDYIRFSTLCREVNVEPLQKIEYAQKVGMLLQGIHDYPILPVSEAYLQIFTDTPYIPQPNISKGLGDTVAKITHATGLDKLAEMYTEITGKPCGCSERQDALNKLVPYGVKEE